MLRGRLVLRLLGAAATVSVCRFGPRAGRPLARPALLFKFARLFVEPGAEFGGRFASCAGSVGARGGWFYHPGARRAAFDCLADSPAAGSGIGGGFFKLALGARLVREAGPIGREGGCRGFRFVEATRSPRHAVNLPVLGLGLESALGAIHTPPERRGRGPVQPLPWPALRLGEAALECVRVLGAVAVCPTALAGSARCAGGRVDKPVGPAADWDSAVLG